ncbi:hypothetical protein ACI6PX_06510 [Proteus sp. NGCRVN-01]|uniref:hypothetical protein n=1 Tax=Proteus TaxID=583 RepID=UPI000F4E26CE|nr:hypothetical protein [Proteus vulgaris]AYY81072.1 hypothetical protein EGX81_09330 [Proteus vulgaris]AYY81161.1 hypothetical protein EGX81_09825 [Proteus vulgaris]
MKIKVEFPLLSNKFSGVEITGDVKRYGIGAIKIDEKPILTSEITVTGVVESNTPNEEPKLQFKYTEDYNPDETFSSFMDRAEKYARAMIERIKAAQ